MPCFAPGWGARRHRIRGRLSESIYTSTGTMNPRIWFAMLVSGTLSACAVGPNYVRPATAVRDAWHAQPPSGVRQESPDAPTLASWWTVLQDPTLDDLIRRGV